MMSKVAIVILNWNGKHFLEKFLPAIQATNFPDFRIVVADNASSDDSVNFINNFYPNIQLILFKENYGFAKGYNEALKQVDSEYSVIINSDVEVTNEWLNPIVKLMDEDKNIAACQPKVRAYNKRTHFEYAAASGGFIDVYGYPFCRGRIFNVEEEDTCQYDDVAEVFWASGACLIVRSEIYKKIGGFDDYFFAHMEEIDLCWRIKKAGYKIMVCPQSLVYHVGGGALPYKNPRKTYLNFRNGLILLQKNLTLFKIFWIIPVRLILDHIAAYKALFSDNAPDYFAIVKAHFHFITNQLMWIRKRREANRFIKLCSVDKRKPNLYGVYKNSLVVDFFIKGKTKFSELKFQ